MARPEQGEARHGTWMFSNKAPNGRALLSAKGHLHIYNIICRPNKIINLKISLASPAGVAQWRPGFDSGQGARLGCRLDPQEGARRRQPIHDSLILMFLAHSLFL